MLELQQRAHESSGSRGLPALQGIAASRFTFFTEENQIGYG